MNVSTDRISKISYKGEEIILMDFRNLALEAFVEQMNVCLAYIKKQNSTDLLYLFDVHNAKIFGEVLVECKKFAVEIKKYRKRTALIGVSSGKKWMLNSILRVAGTLSFERVQSFETLEEAQDWLVSG